MGFCLGLYDMKPWGTARRGDVEGELKGDEREWLREVDTCGIAEP